MVLWRRNRCGSHNHGVSLSTLCAIKEMDDTRPNSCVSRLLGWCDSVLSPLMSAEREHRRNDFNPSPDLSCRVQFFWSRVWTCSCQPRH